MSVAVTGRWLYPPLSLLYQPSRQVLVDDARQLRLKRENKRLRMERDILKKAAAWFARESGPIPGGDTRS